MNPRIILTAAVAGLLCAQVLAQPAKPPAKPAAAAAAGPWAKVPALPTACYSGQDQWWDQNNAAIEAVQETLYAQQEKNSAIDQRANSAMSEDPMAIAQAMQQAMLDDPANAQKMIEKMVQTGQQAQTEVPAQMEKEKQLEAESKVVLKQYEAALAKAFGPGNARWTALKKKMGIAMDSHGPGELGVPDWAWAEWAVILREWDQGYQANCAQWWSATGGFQAYMKRYKDYLVGERIPYERKLNDEPRLNNFKMLGVPADSYRTTTDIEAAIDYMKMASTLFSERKVRPHCTGPDRCE